VIDYINEIKNTQIDSTAMHKLRTLFQTLANACSPNPLKTFPVKIIDEPINKIEFGIRSNYFPELKISEVSRFVIDSLVRAENNMDDTRCLDALCVLKDYCNIVVYSRFNHGLELEPEKLDDWKSPSTISTHISIGDQL
jgi:hypothetical protein